LVRGAGHMATAIVSGQQHFQSLVLSCNKDGMDALRRGQHKAAFEQFKYAEAVLIANQAEGENTSLLAVTCNNLGCYYKKVGKLHGALSYLRRALKMEIDLKTDEVTLAGTHLNICAILSKLEKHDKALQHAVGALDLIDKRVTRVDGEVSQDDFSVLAIAYHNVAVERDFLQQYDEAAAAFQQGYQVANKNLGKDHPLAITLGQNCDAVLQKSQKLLTKLPKTQGRARSTRDSVTGMLPSLAPMARTCSSPESTMPMPARTKVRHEAAAWMAKESKVSEEAAWASFAQSTLNPPPGLQTLEFRGRSSPPNEHRRWPEDTRMMSPLSKTIDLDPKALMDIIDTDRVEHSFLTSRMAPHDSRQNRVVNGSTRSVAVVERSGLINTTKDTRMMSPLSKTIDLDPEALMDIIDADRVGHSLLTSRFAPHDCRPNRVIKGSTRTARVVRRTGLVNTTKHRDQVVQDARGRASTGPKLAYIEKVAAERIQRVWRAWHKYCQENADWMTLTWISATLIQAKWRSYHVRRLKLDKAATDIQRLVRGHLVRRTLRKHDAATTIQRHVVGMQTRMQLIRMQRAAVKAQALTRGGQGRARAREKRHHFTTTALTIQCAFRQFVARRTAQEKRDEKRSWEILLCAVVDIQRNYRGWKGRQEFAARKLQWKENMQEFRAAQRLQALWRRDLAQKRVDNLRKERINEMERAATLIQKMWLGSRTRKRFQELLAEFRRHQRHIITIQRYTRGFLVRLRMWREAVRAEEELWAALEIQRVYRGYLGRVAWESAFEEVWSKEMAAAKLQRNVRGFLCRTKVVAMKRRIARAEFERARKRFRSSQRIQAATRGMLTRKVFYRVIARERHAATQIQRIWRGHILRKRAWQQVIEMRTIVLQAHTRRFLVRNRRFHLMAKVICIQRAWRRWARKPLSTRLSGIQHRERRKQNAIAIQRSFRQHAENLEVGRFHCAQGRPP